MIATTVRQPKAIYIVKNSVRIAGVGGVQNNAITTMSDDDGVMSSSEDEDIWEVQPGGRSRGKGTKTKRADVADQTRAVGSTWHHALDAFALVVSEWVKEMQGKWARYCKKR